MKIWIVHASAGHGHKKVAEALQEEFRDDPHFQGEVKVFDILDFTPIHFGSLYRGSYYFLVKHLPYAWGFGYWLTNIQSFLKPLVPIRNFFNRLHTGRFIKSIEEEKPDWIINTHFLLPSALGPMIEAGRIKTKMMTIVTDFKIHGFWINSGNERYIGMCDETRDGLVEWGVPEEKVSVWGIPIHPKFRFRGNRHLILEALSFAENRETILVTSGSFGIGPIEKFIRGLEPRSERIQVVVVCGNNKTLYSHLSSNSFPFPTKVLGYVNNMDELMEVCDFAIVKPGGSTISELLVKKKPFLMIEPFPGQEVGNGEVLKEFGISDDLRSPEELIPHLKVLEDQKVYQAHQALIDAFVKPDAGKRIVEHVLEKS